MKWYGNFIGLRWVDVCYFLCLRYSSNVLWKAHLSGFRLLVFRIFFKCMSIDIFVCFRYSLKVVWKAYISGFRPLNSYLAVCESTPVHQTQQRQKARECFPPNKTKKDNETWRLSLSFISLESNSVNIFTNSFTLLLEQNT